MPSPDDYLRLTQLRSYCGIDEELRIGRDYESQARRFIAERPTWFAALTLRKALHFWGPFVRNSPAQTAVALLTMAPVLLGGWIAIVWVVIRRHPAAPLAWLALAIAIPVTLPHALSQCDVRYRLGIIDPLWILLAASLVDLARAAKRAGNLRQQIVDPICQPSPSDFRLSTDNGPRTTLK